jgi:hypothetical protein
MNIVMEKNRTKISTFNSVHFSIELFRIVFVVSVEQLGAQIHLDALRERVHRSAGGGVLPQGHDGEGEVEELVHPLGAVIHLDALYVVHQLAGIQLVDKVVGLGAFEGLLQGIEQNAGQLLA